MGLVLLVPGGVCPQGGVCMQGEVAGPGVAAQGEWVLDKDTFRIG